MAREAADAASPRACLTGSVSQRCAMIARCPVVLVKPSPDEGGDAPGQPGSGPVATGRHGSVAQSDQEPT
jgi:hypothetical protein